MKNDSGYAFPTGDHINRDENGNLYGTPISDAGMTKREYYAGLAMQGYLASFAGIESGINPKDVAQFAVKTADALLEELNKS